MIRYSNKGFLLLNHVDSNHILHFDHISGFIVITTGIKSIRSLDLYKIQLLYVYICQILKEHRDIL